MVGLIERLTAQVGSRELALGLLRDRGHVDGSGALTTAGMAREALGAAGRAIDRAAKRSGRSPREFVYSPRTNRARLRR